MKIAVEGCAHGELEKIYETISFLENQGNFKVDLLICCGDFQSTRNTEDLCTMAVPFKFRTMCSFHMYYSGIKVAPVLTIFIGGNHEASNYLQELPYGGWVAPNIYYLGYAGVITVAGVRIGGLSGIYKGNDYYRGRFEYPPYSESTKRSVYHVRNIEVFRMKQIKSPIQVFLTHDWPRGIYNYGNVQQLIKKKPFFEEEVNENKLGSPANEELLFHLKPKYWFAGHLHVKFPAYVTHDNNEVTRFLALDKCLPKRKFLQILDVERDENKPLELQYDLEWLCILHYTNHLISIDPSNNYMPSDKDDERSIFTPTEEEKEFILNKMGGSLKIPLNFTRTAPTYQPQSPRKSMQGLPQKNKQTVEFCQQLGIDNPLDLILKSKRDGISSNFTPEADQSVSFIDSEMSGTFSDDEILESQKESPPKRTSLVLPPPKCESTDEISDDSLFFIDDGSKRSIADSISSSVTEEPQALGVKKFKRRNQNLYQSEC